MTPPRTYDILKSNELISISEDARSDDHYIRLSNLLIIAISDWPTQNLNEPADLLVELKMELHAALSFENLRLFRNKLSYETEAWKIEALSTLLEMFEKAKINGTERPSDLEEIIYDLSEYYQFLNKPPANKASPKSGL